MVLRNDPVLKLFNGDIGIALPDAAAANCGCTSRSPTAACARSRRCACPRTRPRSR